MRPVHFKSLGKGYFSFRCSLQRRGFFCMGTGRLISTHTFTYQQMEFLLLKGNVQGVAGNPQPQYFSSRTLPCALSV